MSIKAAIKKVVNKSQDRYIVRSVTVHKMDAPQFVGVTPTIWVELAVRPRKRKKSAGAYKPFPAGLFS